MRRMSFSSLRPVRPIRARRARARTARRVALTAVALAMSLAAFATPRPACAIGPDAFAPAGPVSVTPYVSLTAVPRGGEVRVAVAVDIREPWHVNAHELDDEFLVPTELRFDAPPGVRVRAVVYPEGHEKKLDFAEKPMMLYDGRVLIGAVLAVDTTVADGELVVPATLTYQACDNQKCLLPAEEPVRFVLRVQPAHAALDVQHDEIFSAIAWPASPGSGPSSRAGAASGSAAGKSLGGSGGAGDRFAGRGLALVVVLVFLGGLALNLTPCVFPIIPITVSYFGGQAGGRGARTTMLALLYLLGMATMYSTLGVIAALTGSLFGSALQNPFVVVVVAGVMVALALSMFGVWEIRVPMRLAGTAGTARQGALGAFLMGLTVGIVAAPCIGPFVLGLLTYVGERGDPAVGFLLFFVLALGLGAPYVVLAIASGNLSRLPRSGEWMEWVRRLFGVILLAMAVYFLDALLPDAASRVLMGAVALVGGIYLGWITGRDVTVLAVASLRRFVGVAAPLVGLWLIASPGFSGGGGTAHVAWQPYDEAALAAAREAGRPVVVDFAAEWCLPCRELDHRTFSDERVVRAMRGAVALRADLTRSSDPDVRRVREKYGIRGVPTVVFIGPDGRERTDLRIVQFVPPERFLERLEALGLRP